MSNNTLEDDRYAVIKLGSGSAPADAVMIGAPFSEVLANIPDTYARTDSIRTYQAAKIDAMKIDQMQKATRAILVTTFADSVDAISRRMDALEFKRAEARAAKMKADAEEEERRIQAELDALPDPDNPAIYGPTGEMHTLSPTATDQGALPKELQKGAPPETGNYPEPDPSALAYPQRPKYEQPVSVSLASEDDY